MQGPATRRTLAAAAFVVAAAALLSADTLVFRDGSRVNGELIAVRGETVEFREDGSGRVVRVRRSELRRIEFETEFSRRDYPAPGERSDLPYPSGDRFDDRGRTPGTRPYGLREREVRVAANTPWTDTGVEVRAGQSVYFSARGEVTWGPNRSDGPEGEHDSPHNDNRPIPNRQAAALIGKVGADSRDYFFIGDASEPIRVRESGRLFLGINDDYLQDNRGYFTVVVAY